MQHSYPASRSMIPSWYTESYKKYLCTCTVFLSQLDAHHLNWQNLSASCSSFPSRPRKSSHCTGSIRKENWNCSLSFPYLGSDTWSVFPLACWRGMTGSWSWRQSCLLKAYNSTCNPYPCLLTLPSPNPWVLTVPWTPQSLCICCSLCRERPSSLRPYSSPLTSFRRYSLKW